MRLLADTAGSAGPEPVSEAARQFDPFDARFVEDPYPFLAEIQSEEPLFYAREIDSWIVTRHATARSILTDPTRFSAKIASDPLTPLCGEARDLILGSEFDVPELLVNNDPPEHGRYRKFFGEPLKFQYVKSLEPYVRDLTDHYIDEMLRSGPPYDLAKGLTWDIPALTLFRLLGIPNEDVPLVKDYADSRVVLLWGRPTSEQQIELTGKAIEFFRYTSKLVEARAREFHDDYPSALLRMRDEQQNPPTIREIIAVTFNLLFAGHETTSSAAANLFAALLSHQDIWKAIRSNEVEISRIVEEGIRFDPPVQAWRRLATVDVELEGMKIPAGSRILVHFAAANRDPAAFAEASTFCPMRKDVGKHLSFGAGTHFCLGAPLAKMEIGIMVERLAARIPDLRLGQKIDGDYLPNTSFRGVRCLPVYW